MKKKGKEGPLYPCTGKHTLDHYSRKMTAYYVEANDW